jgi:CRP-like cAMP-binding protein
MIEIMPEYILDQLTALAGEPRILSPGAYLFHQGDAVGSLFIVAGGAIELVRHQPDGGTIVLQRGTAGTILAGASIYSDRYHCDAIARLQSSVFELPKPLFLDHLRSDAALADFWATHLAREVQSARY